MARALRKHAGDVSFLGPVTIPRGVLGGPFNKISRSLFGKAYDYEHSILLSKAYASIFGRKLRNERFDLVFAPTASTEIAHLETKLPILYSSDTTFALMTNYYPKFSGLFAFSAREGNQVERLAIGKADSLIYPSQWAARSAIEDYGADQRRVHVIPMGANIDEPPPLESLLKEDSGICRLLFLAREWERKGGSIAFETLVKLIELGIDAELVVCGCDPPAKYRHKKLRVVGFLDKAQKDDRARLQRVLAASHFLLVPTRGDCSPIVFCEANAYGIPVVTTDTGGVSELVRNGVNGFALPLAAGGEEYAEVICQVFRDVKLYRKLVEGSRAAFDKSLNWDTWGLRVAELIRQQLA